MDEIKCAINSIYPEKDAEPLGASDVPRMQCTERKLCDYCRHEVLSFSGYFPCQGTRWMLRVSIRNRLCSPHCVDMEDSIPMLICDHYHTEQNFYNGQFGNFFILLEPQHKCFKSYYPLKSCYAKSHNILILRLVHSGDRLLLFDYPYFQNVFSHPSFPTEIATLFTFVYHA